MDDYKSLKQLRVTAFTVYDFKVTRTAYFLSDAILVLDGTPTDRPQFVPLPSDAYTLHKIGKRW